MPTSIELPPARWIALGVLGGGLAARRRLAFWAAAIRGGWLWPVSGWPGVSGVALALAWGSGGFLARSVAAANAPFVGPVAWFDSQPGYIHGSAPIAMADLTVATLAGDRYQHRARAAPGRRAVRAVRARARARMGGRHDVPLPGLPVVHRRPLPRGRATTRHGCRVRGVRAREHLGVRAPLGLLASRCRVVARS